MIECRRLARYGDSSGIRNFVADAGNAMFGATPARARAGGFGSPRGTAGSQSSRGYPWRRGGDRALARHGRFEVSGRSAARALPGAVGRGAARSAPIARVRMSAGRHAREAEGRARHGHDRSGRLTARLRRHEVARLRWSRAAAARGADHGFLRERP